MAVDDASHFISLGRGFTLRRFRYFTRSQPRPFTDGFSPLPPQNVQVGLFSVFCVFFFFSYWIPRRNNRKQRGIFHHRGLTRGPPDIQTTTTTTTAIIIRENDTMRQVSSSKWFLSFRFNNLPTGTAFRAARVSNYTQGDLVSTPLNRSRFNDGSGSGSSSFRSLRLSKSIHLDKIRNARHTSGNTTETRKFPEYFRTS